MTRAHCIIAKLITHSLLADLLMETHTKKTPLFYVIACSITVVYLL